MQTLLFLAVAVVLVGAIYLFSKSRTEPGHRVTVADVPGLLDQLKASTSSPAFAVLMFRPPTHPIGDAVDLQLSMDRGRLGLDWVLNSRANTEDLARFLEFTTSRGFVAEMNELNDIKYARVEGDDLAGLARAIVTELYGLAETAPLDLIVEGFEWRPTVET